MWFISTLVADYEHFLDWVTCLNWFLWSCLLCPSNTKSAFYQPPKYKQTFEGEKYINFNNIHMLEYMYIATQPGKYASCCMRFFIKIWIHFHRLVKHGLTPNSILAALAWKERSIVDDWTLIVSIAKLQMIQNSFCFWQRNWNWNIRKKRPSPSWKEPTRQALGPRQPVLVMLMRDKSPPS